MKIDIVKLKARKFAENIIDMIFPRNSDMFNKIKNTTARYWVQQNIYKLDNILSLFADQNGEIDVDTLICLYEDTIFTDGKLMLDMKKIIPDDYEYLKGLFPDKVVILDKSDFQSAFN